MKPMNESLTPEGRAFGRAAGAFAAEPSAKPRSRIPAGSRAVPRCCRNPQSAPPPLYRAALTVVCALLLAPSAGRAALPPADGRPLPSPESVLVGVQAGAELQRGQDHQIIQTVSQYRAVDGSLTFETNTLTVLATCMFYEQDGQWLQSKEEVEAIDGQDRKSVV